MRTTKEVFLDKIQTAIKSVGNSTYNRVDDVILWVGAADEEINRTVDLSFDSSLRIQIGSAMNYFDGKEANEEKVLRLFIKVLVAEIAETQFFKGDRLLKTVYQMKGFEENNEIGLSSFLNSLWQKEDRTIIVNHPPVLNKEQYSQLLCDINNLYNTA